MNPVAFEVFGMPIRWYGIIIASGVLIAFFVSYLLAKKKGLDVTAFPTAQMLMEFSSCNNWC